MYVFQNDPIAIRKQDAFQLESNQYFWPFSPESPQLSNNPLYSHGSGSAADELDTRPL